MLYRVPMVIIAILVLPFAYDEGLDQVAAQHGGGVRGVVTVESCDRFGVKVRTVSCTGTFRSDDGALVLRGATASGADWSLDDPGKRVSAAAFPPDGDDAVYDVYAVGDSNAGFWAVAPIYGAGWFLVGAIAAWVVRPLRSFWRRGRVRPQMPVGLALRCFHAAPWVCAAVAAQGLSMWFLTEVLADPGALGWVTGFAALHGFTIGVLVLAWRARRAGVMLTEAALIDRGWLSTQRFPMDRNTAFDVVGDAAGAGRVVLVNGSGRHELLISSGFDRDQEQLRTTLEAWRREPSAS